MNSTVIFDVNYAYCKNTKQTFITYNAGTGLIQIPLPVSSHPKHNITISNNEFEYEKKLYKLNDLNEIYSDKFVKIYELNKNDEVYKLYVSLI